MVRPEPRHYLWLAVAIAAVGPSSVIGRLAGEAPPLVISFYRLLFATLLLAPYFGWNMWRTRERVATRDILMLGGVGLMLAAHFAVWVTSLFYTSVASSAVLVATEAIWVPLGAAFVLRERLGGRVWVGIAVAFTGTLALVAGDSGGFGSGPDPVLGDILAVAGAIAASLYFLAGRRFRQRMSLPTYAFIVYAWSTLFLFLFVMVRGDPLTGYRSDTVAWMAVFAIGPMILGHTIINYVLRWIQPHVVSTAILLEPLISSVLAVVVLEERVGLLVYVGGAVVVLGVLLAASKPARHPVEEEQQEGQRAEDLGHEEGQPVVREP